MQSIKITNNTVEMEAKEIVIDFDETHPDRAAAFDEAIKPMVEFVNKYCTPHDIVVIRQGYAEMYSGEMVTQFSVSD